MKKSGQIALALLATAGLGITYNVMSSTGCASGINCQSSMGPGVAALSKTNDAQNKITKNYNPVVRGGFGSSISNFFSGRGG